MQEDRRPILSNGFEKHLRCLQLLIIDHRDWKEAKREQINKITKDPFTDDPELIDSNAEQDAFWEEELLSDGPVALPSNKPDPVSPIDSQKQRTAECFQG